MLTAHIEDTDKILGLELCGVTIRVLEDKERVVLVVEDTGDGIDPAHLPYIFDHFYRADSVRDWDAVALAWDLPSRAGGGPRQRDRCDKPGRGQGSQCSLCLPAADDAA